MKQKKNSQKQTRNTGASGDVLIRKRRLEGRNLGLEDDIRRSKARCSAHRPGRLLARNQGVTAVVHVVLNGVDMRVSLSMFGVFFDQAAGNVLVDTIDVQLALRGRVLCKVPHSVQTKRVSGYPAWLVPCTAIGAYFWTLWTIPACPELQSESSRTRSQGLARCVSFFGGSRLRRLTLGEPVGICRYRSHSHRRSSVSTLLDTLERQHARHWHGQRTYCSILISSP